MNPISLLTAVSLLGLSGCTQSEAPDPAASRAASQPRPASASTATFDPKLPYQIDGRWPDEFTVSPDERWSAWETERAGERTLFLYSVAEHRVTASLKLGPAPSKTYHLAFAPDSKRLAVSQGGEAKVALGLFELPDLKPTSIKQAFDEFDIESFTFSADGGEILLVADFDIHLWDLAANKLTEIDRPGTIPFGVPHRIGAEERLVCFNDGNFFVLGRPDWKELKRWSVGSNIHRFAVAPGAKWAAAFARDAKLVTVWDTVAGTFVKELPHPKELRRIEFSGDGKWLLTNSGDGDVNIWSCDDWTLRGTLAAHKHRLDALVPLASGAAFATVGDGADHEHSEVKRWDLAEVVAKLPRPVAVEAPPPTLAADSFGIAFGHYDLMCGFTDAGRSFFTLELDGVVKLYDAAGKHELRWTLDLGRKVRELEFTADGRRFAIGFVDDDGAKKLDERVGFVTIYDAASRKPEQTLKLESSIPWDLDFSPDGRILAVAGGNAYPTTFDLTLFDVEKGTRLATLAKGNSRVNRVCFSPSGKLLASTDYKEVTVWNVADRTARFKLKSESGAEDLAFSPDEKWLVTASSGEKSGRLTAFDLSDGSRTRWFDDFTDKVPAVAFTPAGDRLVAVAWHAPGQANYQIREIPGGKLLGRLTSAGTNYDTGNAAFSPDGSQFAASVFGGTRLWRAAEFLDPRFQQELAKLKDRGVSVEERDGLLVIGLSDANDRALQEFPLLSCPFALDLSSADAVTDAGLAHLAKQKQLVDLELPFEDKITSAGLSQLKELPLRRLDAGLIDFAKDADLRVLGEFRKLESLRLSIDTDRMPVDLTPLANLTRLRHLEFIEFRATVDALRVLASLPQLESLHFDGYETCAADDELQYLAPLKRLRSLRLSADDEVTGVGLKHITQATEMESLVLKQFKGLSDEGLAQLRPLKRLRELEFGDAKPTAAGFSAVAELTLLESFKLPKGLTDAHLAHLAGLVKLRELDLSNQEQITDAGLAKLDKLTALERLQLGGAGGVTGAGLAAFAGAVQLTTLHLDQCEGLTDEGLAGVAKLTQLEHLDLPKQIGDAGLVQLAPLKNLTWLGVRESKVTPAGAKKFAAGFPERQVTVFGVE